ncbi:MAG: hypothetical protein LBD01_00480 [Puniceicoccales bacterium]|jgi:Trk-type K+ transport system membrane component|nr:hypothetical protein [Puniceicoccales bacterium]
MGHLIHATRRDACLKALNTVLILCGFGALGIFVTLVGWHVPAQWHSVLGTASRVVIAVFVFQELCRILLQTRPLEYVRTHKLECLLAVVAALETFLGGALYEWLGGLNVGLSPRAFTLLYLAFSQLTLLILLVLRGLRNNQILSNRYLAPGAVFMLSFALLILVGTLLLKTPRATPAGIAWTDAFFTATSAACVTGLTTLDTATAFTRHGQWVILGLAQLGGLGVMTFTYFFAYFFAGGVSLRNRIALRDLLSEDTLGQVGSVLGTIVGFTFVCEALGAMAIYGFLEAGPDSAMGALLAKVGVAVGGTETIPAGERPFFAIFHAVMAFCSAGFSTLSGNLADGAVANNGGVLLVILLLVIAGGIGFPVVQNCWQAAGAAFRRRLGFPFAHPPRISTNTSLVLATTLVLFVGGTLIFHISEFVVGDRNSGPHSPWFVSAFYAVAARTSGFTLTSDMLFTPATSIIVMFLMFIGGSPSSTAGGIKTTTLGVAVLSLRHVITGRRDIEAFGRRLNDSIAHRALATILLAIGFLLLVTMSLCLLHPELPVADLAFEAVSATSTAGMSRGITPRLGEPAKAILVIAMFLGRVGVLTCFVALVSRREGPGYRLPEGTIVIN